MQAKFPRKMKKFLASVRMHFEVACAVTGIVGLTIQVAQIGFRVAGDLNNSCVLHGVRVLTVGLTLCLPEFRALVFLIDNTA